MLMHNLHSQIREELENAHKEKLETLKAELLATQEKVFEHLQGVFVCMCMCM